MGKPCEFFFKSSVQTNGLHRLLGVLGDDDEMDALCGYMLKNRAANGVRQTYEYDGRGQLLAVKNADGSDAERYAYDKAGNMVRKTVGGKTMTFTFDGANQLVSSTTDGVTTKYAYDAAGRLVKEGTKAYRYGYLDKVLSVTDGKSEYTYDYHVDGQLARANYDDGKSESFLWDGLALVKRGDEQFINEPHVGGGNPVVSSKGTSYFNDMLGTTLGAKGKYRKYSAAALSAFGEDLTVHSPTPTQNSNFFTGKPFVEGLGHAFLFRNYRASLGKWQTADPLGYPDGWNRLGYCACNPVNAYDLCGGETVVVGSFYDALYHYAYGNGTSATIANSIMLQVLATESFFEDVLGGIVSRLASVPHDQYSDSFSLSGRIRWEQGDVLGRTSTSWNVTINWTATNWQIADSGEFEWRRIDGVGIVHLSTDDDWDFKAHENDPWWRTIFDEYMAGSCADLFSYIRTGNKGKPYHLSGVADVDASKCAYQFRALE